MFGGRLVGGIMGTLEQGHLRQLFKCTGWCCVRLCACGRARVRACVRVVAALMVLMCWVESYQLGQ